MRPFEFGGDEFEFLVMSVVDGACDAGGLLLCMLKTGAFSERWVVGRAAANADTVVGAVRVSAEPTG
jgi:hypothetical protein